MMLVVFFARASAHDNENDVNDGDDDTNDNACRRNSVRGVAKLLRWFSFLSVWRRRFTLCQHYNARQILTISNFKYYTLLVKQNCTFFAPKIIKI